MNRLLFDKSIEITSKNDSLRASSPSGGWIWGASSKKIIQIVEKVRSSLAKNESDFGLHTPFQTNAGFMHLFWLSVTADKRKTTYKTSKVGR